jgi:hypothetical protein
MSESDQVIEHPQNRPRGIPQNAVITVAMSAILVLFSVITSLSNYTVSQNEFKNFLDQASYIIFIGPICVVFFARYSGNGKISTIKLIRKLVFFDTLWMIFNILWALYLIITINLDYSFPCVGGIFLYVIMTPFLIRMYRGMRESRWLDPNSLPHEWEINALDDPTSPSYRPRKTKRKAD